MTERELLELQDKGITLAPGMRFMDAKSVGANGTYTLDFHKTADRLAMDSALAPNVGGPAMFYNVLSPNTVSILFNAMKASQVLDLRKEGSFADETLSIPVFEHVGGTSAYSDFSRGISSDINESYPVRQHYRYKTSITYGDLEVEKASARRVTLAAKKQEAAADLMARTENQVYLRGVAGLKLYGLLNDPNLNEPIQALSVTTPEGAGKTKWTDKAKDAQGVANHIANDILAAYTELCSNNGGHIDPTSPMKLVLSNKRQPFLSYANNFGNTVLDIVKQTISNLEVVAVPECSMTDGEKMFLICSNVVGQEVGYLAFSEKLRVSPVIQEDTYKLQTFSAGTWGCVLTQPNLVSIVTGI